MHDMEAILGISLPIIITLGAFIMVVYIRKFENLERMAMIDKGISPDLFRKEKNTSAPLRWSLLLIGFGVGLLLGYFLDRTFRMDEVAYFSMILICGGSGLGVAYMIEERKAKEKR
jgi:hypothetical protein